MDSYFLTFFNLLETFLLEMIVDMTLFDPMQNMQKFSQSKLAFSPDCVAINHFKTEGMDQFLP